VISKEEREQDRAICKAAPDGPWVPVEVEQAGGWESALRLPSGGHVFGIPSTMLRFIAAARNRMPAYIADAEEMERRIDALEHAIDDERTDLRERHDPGMEPEGARDRLAGLLEARRILRGEP
jgi:hypothetical protein